MHADVRRQLLKTGFLLPSRESQELSSGHQFQREVPFLTELPHWLLRKTHDGYLNKVGTGGAESFAAINAS